MTNTEIYAVRAKQVLTALKSLKDGEGLTYEEIAAMFGRKNQTTVKRLVYRFPDIAKHKIYVPVKLSTHTSQRKVLFVNLKYKKQLLKNGVVTENY